MRTLILKQTNKNLDLVSDMVNQNTERLATKFYSVLLEDDEATKYLSVNSVQTHLKAGLEKWIQALFSCKTVSDIEAVLKIQGHIGEVHAKANIPINLISKGFRLIKNELNDIIISSSEDDIAILDFCLFTNNLLDIAFEEMCLAYVEYFGSGLRTDESFRIFSAWQSMSVERERQKSEILEWENKLFRSITNGKYNIVQPINKSPVGLWIRHKAPLIFGPELEQKQELSALENALDNIDALLVMHHQTASLSEQSRDSFMETIGQILIETEHVKHVLFSMFERMTEMEVGKDALTQLFNRRFMPTILKRELDLTRQKGSKFSVLMIDIDNFKKINDVHGHEAGDLVIQHVASIILYKVRAGDFTFRYGGEEFLVILTDVDESLSVKVAEKIRSAIESTELLLPNNKLLKVTISIGVAISDGNPNYQHLIEIADKLMYKAKASGKNRVVSE